jgi:hypothetical protein
MEGGYNPMSYTTVNIKIDNVPVEVKVGLPLTENFEETFDTGVMVIPFSTRANEYAPYSEVTIEVVDGEQTTTFYYYVASDLVEVVSRQPMVYSHTINLVETTERTTKIACRNIVVTQPIDGSPKSTVYDIIQKIKDICPLEVSSKHSETRQIDAIYSWFILSSKDAPEMSIESADMFEAFKRVASVLVCVPKMRNFRDLDFENYNTLTNEIDSTNIHNRAIIHNSEYDVKTLVANVSNTIGGNDTNVKYYPGWTGYTTFKNESGVLQDANGNMVAYVDIPINKVRKLYLYFKFEYQKYISPGEFETTPVEGRFDFTPFVMEFSAWQLLNVTGNHSQNSTFYYKRLSNYITNIFTINNWEIFNNTIFLNAFKEWFNEYFKEEFDRTPQLITDLREVFYNVEYDPVAELKIKHERLSSNDNTLPIKETYISPEQSISSFEKLTHNLKGVVNRIGNNEITVEKICSFADRLRTKQFYNYGGYKYIVTQVENALYNDHVVSKAVLTKDFNRLSQFVKVNQEQRFLNASFDKALNSFDTYTEYIMISSTEVTGASYNNAFLNLIGRNTVVNTFMPNYNTFASGDELNVNPLVNMIYEFTPTGGSLTRLAMSTTNYGGGNILSFFVKFNDPKIAGYKTVLDIDKYYRRAVSYTNPNGTIESFSIEFCGVNFVEGISSDDIRSRAMKFPEIPEDLYDDYYYYKLGKLQDLMYYKDQNEIFGLTYTLQAYVHSIDRNIYVLGSYFTEYNRALNVDLFAQNNALSVYGSTTETYNKFDDIPKGSIISGVSLTNYGSPSLSVPYLFILYSGLTQFDVSTYKSWALVEQTTGKIVIACNNNNQNLNYFYVNFMNKRL